MTGFGAKPEAADLQQEHLLSADSGRPREQSRTAEFFDSSVCCIRCFAIDEPMHLKPPEAPKLQDSKAGLNKAESADT